jgi:uncharacterized protein YigA (DUF484 family)
MNVRTLMSHIVHVVSMEQVPIIEGSVSFQSKLVSGAQYSGERDQHKASIILQVSQVRDVVGSPACLLLFSTPRISVLLFSLTFQSRK